MPRKRRSKYSTKYDIKKRLKTFALKQRYQEEKKHSIKQEPLQQEHHIMQPHEMQDQPQRTTKLWTEQETFQFIRCFKRLKDQLLPNCTNSFSYTNVLNIMLNEGFADRSITQTILKQKMRSLLAAYRSVQQNVNDTVAANYVRPYMGIMEEIFGTKSNNFEADIKNFDTFKEESLDIDYQDLEPERNEIVLAPTESSLNGLPVFPQPQFIATEQPQCAYEEAPLTIDSIVECSEPEEAEDTTTVFVPTQTISCPKILRSKSISSSPIPKRSKYTIQDYYEGKLEIKRIAERQKELHREEKLKKLNELVKCKIRQLELEEQKINLLQKLLQQK